MPMLKVTIRAEKGKGPAKRARRSGVIPAVIYARGEPTQELAVNEKEFLDVLAEIKGKIGLIDMQVGDEPPIKCLVKMIQRHSTTHQLAHVDFQRIHANEKVTINLPIHLVGTPVGIKMGGLLEHALRELPVRGLPADLPSNVTLDISNLKVGMSLHVSDVKLERVEAQLPPNTPIASVLVPKKVEEAAPAAAAGEAAPVEGEAPKEPEVISEKKAEERAAERAKTEAETKGGKPAKEEKKEEKKKEEKKK